MLSGAFEHSGAGLLAEWVDAEVRTQAVATGYANAFEAIRASVPWHPALSDDAGQPLHPKPVIGGPLLATVVGADAGNSTSASSPAEIRGGPANLNTAISGNSAQTQTGLGPGKKQEDHEQKTPPQSLSDLQGQGGR